MRTCIRRETPKFQAFFFDGTNVYGLLTELKDVLSRVPGRLGPCSVTLNKVGFIDARLHLIVNNRDYFHDVQMGTWVVIDPRTGNVQLMREDEFKEEYQ